MTTNPEAGMRLVRAADLEEVRDLLAERIHGNPARSAGHNARLAVEAMLATAPVAPAGSVDCCPLCSGDCAGANPPVLDCPLAARAQPSGGFLGHVIVPNSGVGAVFVPASEGIPLMGGKGRVIPVYDGLQNVTANPTEPAARDGGEALDLHAIAKDASERVHKNGGCVPQLAYAPILWALQDALAASGEK